MAPRSKSKVTKERARRLSTDSDETDSEPVRRGGDEEAKNRPDSTKAATDQKDRPGDGKEPGGKKPLSHSKQTTAARKPAASRATPSTEKATRPGLARFFGSPSEQPASAPLQGGPGDSEAVPRADYNFLQSAYQGVQEQNNRLTKMLEKLTDTHDRVVFEHAESANDSKRLRQVGAQATPRKFLLVLLLNFDLAQQSFVKCRLVPPGLPPQRKPNTRSCLRRPQ